MSLIQKLKVDHLTFGEIAEMALSRVLREGEGSSRIYVALCLTCIGTCQLNQ